MKSSFFWSTVLFSGSPNRRYSDRYYSYGVLTYHYYFLDTLFYFIKSVTTNNYAKSHQEKTLVVAFKYSGYQCHKISLVLPFHMAQAVLLREEALLWFSIPGKYAS
jgi:hypothetical protein